MTLITSFDVQGCPVLFGDLLISSDENLKQTISVPTINEITKIFPKGSGFVPTSLRQKVALINENLALAWSGSALGAKVILGQLIQEAPKKLHWNLVDLSAFFKDFDGQYGEDVGIVGFSNDGKGIFSFGYGKCVEKFSTAKYGLVRLSGSGAIDFKKYLDMDIPLASRAVNPLENAVGTTLLLSTHMHGLESISGMNLLQYYGGGFEMASYVRKKFQKIDDITYLVWTGFQEDDLSWRLNLPRAAIKYYYENDVLLIRKIDFVPETEGCLKCENESLYFVSPIYRIANPSELKNTPFSFNSRFICHFVILTHIDGSVEILNRVNFSSNGTNPVKFTGETTGGMTLSVSSDFVESIFKHLPSAKKA